MTRSVLERLRPAPGRPDPTWSAETLDSILRSPAGPQHDSSAAAPSELVLVGAAPGPSAPGARRRKALVAAAVVLLAGAGLGLAQEVPSRTVLASPAAPAPQADQAPVATDLGALPADQRQSLVGACGGEADPSPVVQVHYARRTSDGSSGIVRSAAVVEDRRGEYRLCVSPPVNELPDTELSGYGPGVLGPGGDLSPTTERPLSVISVDRWGFERQAGTFVDIHLAVAYAVTSQVDRVEVRLVGSDADERWFAGTVQGGFAYVPVFVPRLDAPDGSPDVTVESRGYDADGRLVATDSQHHLNGTRDFRDDERLFWR